MVAGIATLQDFTFVSKYAHFVEASGRRETWLEANDRVFDMHLERFAVDPLKGDMADWTTEQSEIYEAIQFAREQAKAMKAVGSQRCLQFGGPPVFHHNARAYNCVVSYADRPRFFGEAMYLLLCGCGVGFSVQKHHVAKLPPIERPHPASKQFHYVIPDNVYGWSDALNLLLHSYFRKEYQTWDGVVYDPKVHGVVTFDYSLIRPEGAALRGGFKDRTIGKAPGPAPLRRSIEIIRGLLGELVPSNFVGTANLRPVHVYDIVMHASDAVLAGGVRRSATICLFSPDDEEMLTAKVGDWMAKNPQRGRSNNSAVLVRGETTQAEFKRLIQHTKEYGEPGFVWVDHRDMLVNPCVEIGMYAMWEDEHGVLHSGWQFCNLTTINGAAISSESEFLAACRAAAITGTLQAAYTSFPYLGRVTEEITKREALLGVSITGMMDNPDLFFDPGVQRRGAEEVKRVNEWIAKLVGINPAARCTCIKPSGNSSAALGSADGIHARHARAFFRTVQANIHEAPYLHISEANPLMTEKSVWNPNGTDAIVRFPCEVGEEAKLKSEVTAIDQLRFVRVTQQNWVEFGRRPERCAQPWLTHNVSNTVHVGPKEWDDVAEYIFKHREDFCGISLIGAAGELDYPQAPYVEVWDEFRIVDTYGPGTLFASGLIVDGLHAFGDLWLACGAALGKEEHLLEQPRMDEELKVNDTAIMQFTRETTDWLLRIDWVRRAEKFAKNYFNGDIKEMTYCLKRVHYLKLWRDIHREWKAVDFTMMKEDSGDQINMSIEPACAGGACET